MSDYRVERALEIGAELGEHPLWSEADASLYWLDIEKATLNRFDPDTGANRVWALPSRPGCFAFASGGVVLAAQDGIYAMDLPDGGLKRIAEPAHDKAELRFNDGHTDRQGRLWVGTVRTDMDLARSEANAFYRLDANGLTQVLDRVGIPNGTAFSPDGRILYRAQTELRTIFAHDYDPATGTPSNQHVFAVVPDAYGMPDGAAVDSEGGYWVALARPPGTGPQGGVARFAPDGRLDRYIELPVPFVTMPAFGGPDLSTLYVTTARLEAFMPGAVPPGAGDLFRIETEFRGAPEAPLQQADAWMRNRADEAI